MSSIRETAEKLVKERWVSVLTDVFWNEFTDAVEKALRNERERAAKTVAHKVAILRDQKRRVKNGSKYDIAFIDGGLGVMEKLLEDLIEQEGDTVGDVRDRAESLIAAAIRKDD